MLSSSVRVLLFLLIMVSPVLLEAVEVHGHLQAIYNPRKEIIYTPYDRKLNDAVLAPMFTYLADQQKDPVVRHYMTTEAKKEVRKLESEYKVVHNFYQFFAINAIGLGDDNGTLILQGRMASMDAENQAEMSIRQLYYSYKELHDLVKEIRVGREVKAHAAGYAHYDGASVLFQKDIFYLSLYGGALIDNDYLHKDSPRCRERMESQTCWSGGDWLHEDYSNKWDASDVRNAASKERKGDSISGIAIGFRHDKVKLEIDYQHKTDFRKPTEEIGGVNLNIIFNEDMTFYGRSRLNFQKGEQYGAIAGFTYRLDNWRFIPEYEYYKPRFKEGSFWEDFNPYARSSARLNIHRNLGRKMSVSLMGGKIYYLEDFSRNESITAKTTIDPNTGEVIGARDKKAAEVPTNFFDFINSPTTSPNSYDPTAQLFREDARPATPLEAAILSNYYNREVPDGNEGSISVTYLTDYRVQYKFLGTHVEGPEGMLNKASLHLSYPWRKFRFTAGGGAAFYKDNETKTDTRQVIFGDLMIRYVYNFTTHFFVGGEYYSDYVYAHDVRGRAGFKYVF